jgi:hypothetical protein
LSPSRLGVRIRFLVAGGVYVLGVKQKWYPDGRLPACPRSSNKEDADDDGPRGGLRRYYRLYEFESQQGEQQGRNECLSLWLNNLAFAKGYYPTSQLPDVLK